MNKANMDIVKLLIEDELSELSRVDKDTILRSIEWLITDLEIDDYWINRASSQDKSLEKYIFDGVVGFMEENQLTADELYNHEDQTEIFDYIHK